MPAAVKGIIHVLAHNPSMTPSRRDTVLMAIAKARTMSRVGSFAMLARRESKVERHGLLGSEEACPLYLR